MSEEKVYPMNDDYNQAMNDLLEFIKLRDEIAESLKIAPPDKVREGQEILAEMDKKIESLELVLAREYESYQNLRRTEEKRDEVFEDMFERMVMVFIHIKYRHPEKLEEMRAALLNNYTPEEEQAFYDRVAILEADDLIKIIAREGETREQTEEFLKNYKAEQIKRGLYKHGR